VYLIFFLHVCCLHRYAKLCLVAHLVQSAREIELGFKGTVLLGDSRSNGHAVSAALAAAPAAALAAALAAAPAAAASRVFSPTLTCTTDTVSLFEASRRAGPTSRAQMEPILVEDSFGDDGDADHDAAAFGSEQSNASPATEQRDSGTCMNRAKASALATCDPLLDDADEGGRDDGVNHHNGNHMHYSHAHVAPSAGIVLPAAPASPVIGSSPIQDCSPSHVNTPHPQSSEGADDLVVVPPVRLRPGKRGSANGSQTPPKRSRADQPVHMIDM
jgi:hypothetical protein